MTTLGSKIDDKSKLFSFQFWYPKVLTNFMILAASYLNKEKYKLPGPGAYERDEYDDQIGQSVR